MEHREPCFCHSLHLDVHGLHKIYSVSILIVCEAVRRVCPYDDDRDTKDDDWSNVCKSEQFSWKQFWNATIVVLRRQKPSTNALDGSYVKGLLGWRLWWVISDAYMCLAEKLPGLPFSLYPQWCRFSPHTGWRDTFYSIPLMPRKGGMVWVLVIYSLNFRRWHGLLVISEPWLVFNLNNNNKGAEDSSRWSCRPCWITWMYHHLHIAINRIGR